MNILRPIVAAAAALTLASPVIAQTESRSPSQPPMGQPSMNQPSASQPSASQPSGGQSGGQESSTQTGGSQAVRNAQQKLAEAGHDPGAQDGIIGPQTTSAVRDFQQAKGLTVTGELDGPTMHSLGADRM